MIIRKYSLGGSNYFFELLSSIDDILLKEAWQFAKDKIHSRNIIKNSNDLSLDQLHLVDIRLADFIDDPQTLLYFLKSDFNVKELKLFDEQIERRLRYLIAFKYIVLVSQEISNLSNAHKNLKKSSLTKLFQKHKGIIIIAGIITAFFIPRIIDGLTPVDALTEKIHEKSKYKFNGSICNDGHISHSQGRGSCSWHGGVNYYFYKGEYSKSIEECRNEAVKLSWFK